MLEEANITSRTTFTEFAQKYSRDERFKNIEKMRERESMFNDYLSQVKKREREEKSAHREKVKQFMRTLLPKCHSETPSRTFIHCFLLLLFADSSRFHRIIEGAKGFASPLFVDRSEGAHQGRLSL